MFQPSSYPKTRVFFNYRSRDWALPTSSPGMPVLGVSRLSMTSSPAVRAAPPTRKKKRQRP